MRLLKKNKPDLRDQLSLFINKEYQMHNVARLKHLDTLGIQFNNKQVLEVGAGIGDHTFYLLMKGANVIASDGRQELVDFIKKRFEVETIKFDVETELNILNQMPKLDIVYCYGLLYHINNPEEFLRALKGRAEMVLLETCVSSDHLEDSPHFVDENKSNYTQALSGNGCRPSRNWIYSILKENFNHVYTPISQPDHIEFPKDWNIKYHDSRVNLIRCIFIASNNELQNRNLQPNLPKIYL